MARDTRIHSAQPVLATQMASMCGYGDSGLAVVQGAITDKPGTSTVAAGTPIADTAALVATAFPVKANMLQAGSVLRVRILGECTSTHADSATFTLRYGSAGTTADASQCTLATTSGIGSAIPFEVSFYFVVRTATTAASHGVLSNSGVTGISDAAIHLGALGTTTISTILDRFLSVSFAAGAATTAITVEAVEYEVIVS